MMIRGLVTTTAKSVQKEDWKNLLRIMKSKVTYDAEAAMAFEYHIIKHQRDKLILFVNRAGIHLFNLNKGY